MGVGQLVLTTSKLDRLIMFLLSLNGNVNEPGFSRLVLKGDRSSFFICFCFGLYWIELRVSMCPFAEGDAPTRLFIFSSLVKS